MTFISPEELTMALRLFIAVLIGAAVGYEREYVGKAAGIRTYSLVCLGACLFTLISIFSIDAVRIPEGLHSSFRYNYDPTRIVSQIVVGIGFLGAGLIVFRGFRVEGLTTAAGLWVVAAIGTAIGFGFYFIALFAAFLELSTFYILKRIEPPDHRRTGSEE